MKLYHNGAAEGWQIPGKQDKHAARVDVPSSPELLAAWLNVRRVTAGANNLVPIAAAPGGDELLEQWTEATEALNKIADQPPIGDPQRCSNCKSRLSVSIAGADKSAISRDLTTIADWAEAAPDWALERLSEMLIERARNHPSRGRVN